MTLRSVRYDDVAAQPFSRQTVLGGETET